jgi:hypothetical protein
MHISTAGPACRDEPLDLSANQALIVRIEAVQATSVEFKVTSALEWLAANATGRPALLDLDLAEQHDHYLSGVRGKYAQYQGVAS